MRALSLAVLISISVLYSLNTRAQVGIAINCADGWWASCCRCGNCLTVDPPPAYGFCRECHLLCPNCRKTLGDLAAALEKLKAKNRALKEAYDAFEKSYGENLENYVKGYENLYGEEGTGTLSGLTSTLGKFASSYASVVSNATGVTNFAKAVTTSIQLYQSSSAGDAAINSGGGLLDVANSQWGMRAISDLITNEAGDKMVRQLNAGVPFEKAVNDFFNNADCFPDTPAKWKDISNAGEWAGLALDIYGYAYANQDLWDNLGDISESVENMDDATAQMSRISDSIVKNVDLMICIRETQDSLNSGGLGMIRNENSLMASTRPFIGNSESTHFGFSSFDSLMLIDRESLKSALAQSGQLLKLTKAMVKSMEKDVITPLVPWLTKKWSTLKKGPSILLLQKAKKGIQAMLPVIEKIKTMAPSIETLLRNAVLGYEVDHINAVSPGNELTEKWQIAPNSKIKAGKGRMAFNFPGGTTWRVEFWKGKDYITSYSSVNPHPFHELDPGSYDIDLNHIKVNNVTIGNGNETRMKYGILHIVNNERWEIYTANKANYLTSGLEPVKMPMVPGTYVINMLGKDHTITITDRLTVRFELPNPRLKYE
jgi:hypothetical protein